MKTQGPARPSAGISELSSPQNASVVIGGRKVLMLGSNNYLGLVNHPAVKAAVIEAVDRYGVGSCINPCFVRMPVHAQLEQEVANHLSAEDAVLFSSCSTASAGVLATLASDGDLIFSDRMNHASIIDGCRLSPATTIIYDQRRGQPAQLPGSTSNAQGKAGHYGRHFQHGRASGIIEGPAGAGHRGRRHV